MRDRIVRLLVIVVAGFFLACAGGCAAGHEPLRPASGHVTVIVCRSLSVFDIANGAATALKPVAARGSAALVARAPRGGATLGESLAGLPITVIDAGDAAVSPLDVVVAVNRVLDADPDATVVLASDAHGARHGLVVALGPGIGSGLLASANTHREGLVAHEDVGSLVRLLASGDTTVAGAAVGSVPTSDAIAVLAKREAYYEAARKAQAPIVIAFGVAAGLAVLGLGVVAVVVQPGATRRYWTAVSARALLFALCLPAATLLARVLDPYPTDAPRLLTEVLGVAGVLWIVAIVSMERVGLRVAVLATSVVTATVLVVDQLSGASLAPGTALAYAPLAGFRFYGIGNEGAAILVGSWLAASALAHGMLPYRVWKRAVLGSGTAVVLVSSLPLLGANSVVAVWGTVTVGVLSAAATRGGLRLRDLAAIAVAAAVAVGVVVAVERLVGVGTHVGTAVAQAQAGSGALTVALDRFIAVVQSYARHPAALAGFLAWVLLAAVRLRPPGSLASVVAADSGVGAALTASLMGGVVASSTEDSSVVVMVLLILYAAVVLVSASADGERKEA